MKTTLLIFGAVAVFCLGFFLDQIRLAVCARRARRERESFDRMRSVVFPPGWDFGTTIAKEEEEKLQFGGCGQNVNGSNETTQETAGVHRTGFFFAKVSKGNGAGKNR